MTQEKKHSPERWNWRGPWHVVDGYEVHDSHNVKLFVVRCPWQPEEWDESAAARIVACVNACEFMLDPASEIAELRARVAELENEAGHGN